MSEPTTPCRVIHVRECDGPTGEPMNGPTARASLAEARDGFEVFATADHGAALDRLASDQVDCVVVESADPGRETTELLRAVRAGHPRLPCVLSTPATVVPAESVALDLSAVVHPGPDDDPLAPLAAAIVEAVATARSEADRERERRDRRRYESIVERMSDVAYTVDESLAITYVNDRALTYAEEPRSGIVGRPLRDVCDDLLTDEAAVADVVDALERVLTGASDRERLDLEIDLPGGAVFAELRVTPLWTDDGRDRPKEAVVVSRDVTDRVEYERTLERQNERLDTFSSVVSHDLRAPLSVARGNLELARDSRATGDDATAEERLDAVARAHRRMGDLIDDLLAVARQGTRVDTLASVDVDAVATESWSFVDGEAGTVDVDTGLVVRADESRLRQLFENLFRNAVEHGAPGVHVRVGALADADGFFVEDDGPGIPPDARERVFEGGYSTTSEGTGFGLMIVDEIAEAHDWSVSVTDATTGGARFEVRNVRVESA